MKRPFDRKKCKSCDYYSHACKICLLRHQELNDCDLITQAKECLISHMKEPPKECPYYLEFLMGKDNE